VVGVDLVAAGPCLVASRSAAASMTNEYSGDYDGHEAAITLVAGGARASYALAGCLHARVLVDAPAGAYILLSDGSDEASREGWAAAVLQTRLFCAASRFRLQEGLPGAPQWLEVFETVQADPVTAYQRALDALAPRVPAAGIRRRSAGCLRRTSRNGSVRLPTT
jgi:hypothetical protein